ncbi:MAG: DUF255 domain-containing protein [Bacteroidota bacterium]
MKNKLVPLLLLIIACLSGALVFGQVDQKKVNTNAIEWMTWEEVQKAQKKEKRKVFVDVYTDWCGWCKKMDKTTFRNKTIIKYLNQNFYAVKFDAETRETITLDGKKYDYVENNGRRGYNELAADLLKGRLSYPSTVFLNEDFSLIQPIPGMLEADQLEMIATYFGEDQHKKTPWTRYEKTYVPINKRKAPLKQPAKKEPKASLTNPGDN